MDPVELLETLLPIDATGGHEQRVVEKLAPLLERLGFDVTTRSVPGGRVNLLASPRGTAPSAILCSHLDTVPPHLPHRREGSIWYGRGACDAKGQIAAMVSASQRAGEVGAPTPALLFVSGEETDHAGAIACEQQELPFVPIVLGEPTCGQMIQAGKGILKLEARTRGVAAHSAFPERGRSATEPLILALHRLLQTRLPVDPILGPSTLNIAMLDGGIAANVIPDRAGATLFLRASTPTSELHEIVANALGDQVELDLGTHADPIHFRTLPGFELGTVAFGTDGPFLPPGRDVFLMGPGDIRVAHSVDEHILISDLRQGVESLLQLLANLATSP